MRQLRISAENLKKHGNSIRIPVLHFLSAELHSKNLRIVV